MALKVTPELLRVGDYLYSSCAAERFGEIVDVDYESAQPTADIRVYDPLELMQWDATDDCLEELSAEQDRAVLPPVIVRRVPLGEVRQSELAHSAPHAPFTGHTIELKGPWQGCYRCVHLLAIQREPRPVDA